MRHEYLGPLTMAGVDHYAKDGWKVWLMQWTPGDPNSPHGIQFTHPHMEFLLYKEIDDDNENIPRVA